MRTIVIVGAALLGGLLSIALVGMNVCAAGSLNIIEGATGTYVKGSLKDHTIKLEASSGIDVSGITVDDDKLVPGEDDKYQKSEETPETPAPSETPDPSETTTPPIPAPSEPVPSASEPAPSETLSPSEAAPTPTPATIGFQNFFAPVKVYAAETDTKVYTLVISGTYLETLFVGEHKVTVSAYDDGELISADATINVAEASAATTETQALQHRRRQPQQKGLFCLDKKPFIPKIRNLH